MTSALTPVALICKLCDKGWLFLAANARDLVLVHEIGVQCDECREVMQITSREISDAAHHRWMIRQGESTA